MRSSTAFLLGGLTAGLLSGCQPDDPWVRAPAQSQGLDSPGFGSFVESVQRRGTEALLVIVNDRVVHEWYAPGRSPDDRHYTASMQKGLVGGLGLGLLLQEGRIGLDERAAHFVTQWQDEPQKSDITIRQLAGHRSGLESSMIPGVAREDLTGWKAAFWHGDSLRNPPRLVIEQAAMEARPGSRFQYSSSNFAVLSYVLGVAAEEGGHANLRSLLADSLFRPIGIDDDSWRMGYGGPIDTYGTEVWAAWGGGAFTPRSLARIGRLLLRRGDWDGQRLIDEDVIEDIVTYGGTPIDEPARHDGEAVLDEWTIGAPAPGMGWWTNATGVWEGLPRDAFAAVGAEHQLLLVVPSLDMIVVRMGGDLRETEVDDLGHWVALSRYFMAPLAGAILPPVGGWSTALTGAWFEPLSAVKCRAIGSDNWPITWTEDGSLFTSYGDGWGFRPRVPEKLSLGFSLIAGTPASLRARNLRSETGERHGDGPEGAKSSGILDVNGTLYMWARNLDTSQLAWSVDGGRTWEWGLRFSTSFGSPTFLQFGPGYSGARDDYVYSYSQDGPSAYESDQHLVLARVHRDSIRHREAYDLFAGLAEGVPRWHREIARRQPVFEYEAGVGRSEVVYSPELDRYILALGLDLQGAWGLFDAPEPWGPWSTIFVTRQWDVGETHSYRIPTKWVDRTGREAHVVFSGLDGPDQTADAFCIRRVSLLQPTRTVTGG